jgi:predicted dinucleotide-binding enzyme
MSKTGFLAVDIAIIGAGQVGSALAAAWARSGLHGITFGVRRPGEAAVADRARALGATVAAPAEAVGAAALVVLALPWRAARDAVAGLGDLGGKVVIDCMNPLAMGENGLGLAMGFSTSGAETVAGWLPGARVVKTLNQVGAEVMADARRFAVPPAMPMAGDDAAAKRLVGGLLAELGFEPIDAGGLARARLLEPFGMTWIALATSGRGRDWAFAAVGSRADLPEAAN